VEPKELPLIGEVERTPEAVAYEKELAKRTAAYDAEVKKRYDAEVKKLRAADAIAAYLRGALDAKATSPRELRGFARQRDLNGYVLGRWREYLDAQVKKQSPVFAPLAALHAIPEKEFGAKAAAAVAGFGKPGQPPVHP